jgi:hypothetical protein
MTDDDAVAVADVPDVVVAAEDRLVDDEAATVAELTLLLYRSLLLNWVIQG